MPSVHDVRAWIACSVEEWTRFKALATIRSSDGAHLLGELVRGELERQGVQLTIADASSGQESPDTVKLRRRARLAAKPAPAKRTTRPSKATGAPVTARKRRKALPVVDERELRKAAVRGAAAAKRPSSKRRGTIAAPGADQHDAVIAKANKRSVSTKKGRPTRRRSS